MSLWLCGNCGCRFAVGLPYCPQCTSTDCREDTEMAPKTTVHNGPSDASVEGDDAWPGTSSSTSTEPAQSSESSSEQPDQLPAPTTENPSSTGQTAADSTAPSTDGESTTTSQSEDQPDDYDDLTVEQLKDELDDRELTKSGNKAELIARLREHDATA